MAASIPEPRIVVSKRAKGVRLKVCAFRGFTISVPPRFRTKDIPGIIDRQREWLERSLEQARAYRSRAIAEMALPDTVSLPACAENWTLRWMSSSSLSLKIDSRSCTLELRAPERDSEGSRELLRRFLVNRARGWLEPEMRRVANEVGLSFDRLSVRIQATRWGSCSSKKNISLNARLLFLEPSLVRHIMLHELAHTRVMNHSPQFRQLLATLSPASTRLDRQMRLAVNIPPKWSDPRLEPSRLPPL